MSAQDAKYIKKNKQFITRKQISSLGSNDWNAYAGIQELFHFSVSVYDAQHCCAKIGPIISCSCLA
jgi:hypothetical protein